MATPAEIKARELKNLSNRSEQQNLPIPVLQLDPLPVEITRAFPAMDLWLKAQNAKLVEHTKKLNVILVPQGPQSA